MTGRRVPARTADAVARRARHRWDRLMARLAGATTPDERLTAACDYLRGAVNACDDPEVAAEAAQEAFQAMLKAAGECARREPRQEPRGEPSVRSLGPGSAA